MASNQHTGINPLGIPRIDVTEAGINSAFAIVSREVAKRTPRESQSEGSIHTQGGVFSVPPTPITPERMRPAFNAVMFTKDGKKKAHFQAAFVINEANIVPIFDDPDTQTLDVEIGDVMYTKIITDDTNLVLSATFAAEVDPVDIDPSPGVNGETYVKCVEFVEGDVSGTFKPVYYRYDSIIWVDPAAGVISYTIFFADETEITITEADALDGYIEGFNDDWSLEFAVSATGEFTKEYEGVDESERFPEVDDVQTAYRLPIIRSRTVTPPVGDPTVEADRVSSGGLYQEVKMCIDGTPFTQLIKVG